MINGARLERIASTARAIAVASPRGLAIVQTRGSKNCAGYSNASVCVSCGKASVTAPVSAGEVSTRMASGSAVSNCSAR